MFQKKHFIKYKNDKDLLMIVLTVNNNFKNLFKKKEKKIF